MRYYEVKKEFLETKENNAYSRAKIESLGFSPIYTESTQGGENISEWEGGWAKPILLPYVSEIAKWAKRNIEQIYKQEKKHQKETGHKSNWLKEMTETGYRFNKKGRLVENVVVTRPIEAQLCVFSVGENSGALFINVSGAVEFYSVDTLNNSCPQEIELLKQNGVIQEIEKQEKQEKEK